MLRRYETAPAGLDKVKEQENLGGKRFREYEQQDLGKVVGGLGSLQVRDSRILRTYAELGLTPKCFSEDIFSCEAGLF